MKLNIFGRPKRNGSASNELCQSLWEWKLFLLLLRPWTTHRCKNVSDFFHRLPIQWHLSNFTDERYFRFPEKKLSSSRQFTLRREQKSAAAFGGDVHHCCWLKVPVKTHFSRIFYIVQIFLGMISYQCSHIFLKARLCFAVWKRTGFCLLFRLCEHHDFLYYLWNKWRAVDFKDPIANGHFLDLRLTCGKFGKQFLSKVDQRWINHHNTTDQLN